MEYSLNVVLKSDSSQSVAIPFRILEIFTSTENASDSCNNTYLRNIFAYLVQNHYFEQVRKLIDAKIPSLLEPSSTPPTPMARYFLEMIQRALSVVNRTANVEFCYLILHKFCCSILSPPMTEPISFFIIPALGEFQEFPYNKLISSINHLPSASSVSLFYSVLVLEPSEHGKF